MKKIIAICLLFVLLSGCAQAGASDLMKDISANPVSPAPDLGGETASITNFAVELFRTAQSTGENTLISPISVIYALSMTANGASGDTLAQMEDVLGLPVETLNTLLHSYMEQLPNGEKYKLNLANSIWFKDDDTFTVEPDFLQTNADYYGAAIYRAPFDDSTRKAINRWVKENTDGMIPEILDQIPQDAVMYLVNALAFDAQWQTIYKDTQIRDGVFTTEGGKEQKVKLMYSTEGKYLEDENATGFIKYYADRKYAFAALLPNEGITVDAYLSNMTGEHLSDLLADPVSVTVYAAIPKFKTEYSAEMSEILQKMGMTEAFDCNTADFSRLGSSGLGNLYINRVLHKTFLALDEKGTKAGAATAVEFNCESAAIQPEDVKTVTLDRPFLYLLIDCENNVPIFIGTMMNAEAGKK